jgi:hypothetical protein
VIRLGPTEEVADHPFTAVGHGRHDVSVMNRMLDRLRCHVGRIDLSAGPRDDRFVDHGEHMIVLPNPSLLPSAADLVAVGFFGQARSDVDHGPIVAIEERLVRLMPRTPGLVAYYNVHRPPTEWGNLVLFTGDTAKDGWGDDELHRDAIARSSDHYHSIRLHNAVVAGGVPGGAPIRLVRTKYLDFDHEPTWRALREITGDR